MKIDPILAPAGLSISEFKKNPSAAIAAAEAEGIPLAILNRNSPAAYLIPARDWEAIMDRLEDMELAELARQRLNDPEVEVSIEDL